MKLYAIGAYCHYSCEFDSCLWQGVFETTLCDQVNPRIATGYNWNIVESDVNIHNLFKLNEPLLKWYEIIFKKLYYEKTHNNWVD